MSTPTPALDFCRKVAVWQDAGGSSAGLPVLMPEREQGGLNQVLMDADRGLDLRYVEDRARRWLIGYREIVAQQGGLTPAQEAELNHVVDDRLSTPYQAHAQPGQKPSVARFAVTILAVIIVVAAALAVTKALIGNGNGNGSPPPAGPVAAAPAGPQPGPLTDLQQFRADWNVPHAATAGAGNPAGLVLLQDGLYYPVLWSIPSGDPGWVTDTTGNVLASVRGLQADVTDSSGATWTVAVGQPFVLASNPQVVYRVLRDGTTQTMPQPHAIRIRVRT